MSPTHRIALAWAALALCACDNAQSPQVAVEPETDAPPVAVTPIVAAVPDVASMRLAVPVESGKVGVPVDVRYALAGAAMKDVQAPLDLAFVPRVAGSGLEVTFLGSASTSIDDGAAPFAVAKADASSVHRRRLTVTPKLGDTGELRVQVVMNVGDGRYSSIFSIPVGGPTAEATAK
jgi:hypothetical protein